MLPAQNATGNWVKIVQRIPVRVAIDDQGEGPTLRAGMSARRRDRYRAIAARWATSWTRRGSSLGCDHVLIRTAGLEAACPTQVATGG